MRHSAGKHKLTNLEKSIEVDCLIQAVCCRSNLAAWWLLSSIPDIL